MLQAGTVPARFLAGLGYGRQLGGGVGSERSSRPAPHAEETPRGHRPLICARYGQREPRRGVPLYHRDNDYRFFLSCLRDYAARDAARVHAFCLMGNHVHLLVEATDTPISRTMHTLLQRYAQYVNRLHGYRGHLFADRFWARVCSEEYDVLAVLRYVHQNPLRAGLVPRLEL